MLSPDARSVLSDVLRPPPGSVLSRAVALTFTLDLESALVVPLAFAASAVRESSDPLAVMEGVRRCADRVDVFCQAGNVRVPARYSDLLAFAGQPTTWGAKPYAGQVFDYNATVIDKLAASVCIAPASLLSNGMKERRAEGVNPTCAVWSRRCRPSPRRE